MNRFVIFSIVCLVLGGIWWMFSGSQQEDMSPKLTKNDLIAATVQERIDNFIQVRKKKCVDDRLADAILRVDSILIARAKSQRDTFDKPPKPFKPDRPEILILEDTTPIAPILTLEKDSLN